MEVEHSSIDHREHTPATKRKLAALTSTESRLLDVLRGDPGRVFSRSELIAVVMPDTVVLERTIDVHIKALRQKLGVLGGQIETIRGAGYRFRAEDQRGRESLA